jgi:hypothetical protein
MYPRILFKGTADLDLGCRHTFLDEIKAQITKTSTGIVFGLPQVRGGCYYWELYEVRGDKPLFARAMAMSKGMLEYDTEMAGTL